MLLEGNWNDNKKFMDFDITKLMKNYKCIKSQIKLLPIC